jgi:aspartate/methionine/tyrosine aminotransferase
MCDEKKNNRIPSSSNFAAAGGKTRFSNRLNFSLETNQLTRLREEMTKQGKRILDLTRSNPTEVGLSYSGHPLSQFLDFQGRLTYHPDPKGIIKAREAIAQHYRDREINISAEDICLTSSTSEAYSYLFKLLADPGDQILIPQPSYPLFDYLARFDSVRPVPYPLYFSDSWQLDLESLVEKITPKTRAVLVVHPNNPTGHFITGREWKELTRICIKNELTLICDEVFFDYPLIDASKRFDPLQQEQDLCFFLNGLSKLAGLPQLKLSWIVVRGPKKLRSTALEKLELIGDTYLSVNSPVQECLPQILQGSESVQQEIRSRIRTNYQFLQETAGGTLVSLLDAEGGWSAVLRLPAMLNDREWAIRLLRDRGTMTHPGDFFGFPTGSHLVLSLLVQEEEFRSGVAGILKSVNKF